MLTLFSTNLAARLGGRKVVITNATETLLVVFEQRNMAAVSPLLIRVVDEAGLESSGTPCMLFTGSPNQWFYRATLENFPRRQPSFRLRVYDQVRGGATNPARGTFTNLAEFTLKVPARRTYPEWKPVPLPATAHAGREQLTLVRFNTGLHATGVLGQSVSRSWTELAFRWNTNDWDSGPWIPKEVEVSDATGNRTGGTYGKIFRQNEKQYWQAPQAGWVNLPCDLWMDEPAWKVRATFTQVRKSNFREESFWRIPGVAVPAADTYVALNLSTQFFGAKLELKGIAGGGARLPRETANDPRPRVQIGFRPPNRMFDFSLLKAIDQRGIELRTTGSGFAGGERVIRIHADDQSKSLDLVFAVHEPHTFEFLAKPTLLMTNIAALQADPTTNQPPPFAR